MPNMVNPIPFFLGSFFSSAWFRSQYAFASPEIAPAALSSIPFSMELVPAMSTTLYIIVISVSPTYGPVFPLAIVDTSSLGNPIGSPLRMMDALRDVPPDPPSPIIAWMDFFSKRDRMRFVAQMEMCSMYSPRERVE